MFISIKVTTGAKVLRPFGLVDVNAQCSLTEVYQDLTRGVLSTGDRFILPNDYEQCCVEVLVSKELNGKFQSVPLTAKVTDCLDFGKYFQFTLNNDENPTNKSTRPTVNAFDLLLRSRGEKVWPAFRNIDRPNARFQLHNAIVRWLQGQDLGWQKQSKSMGDQFVRVLGDCLWITDPHRQTFHQRSCPIPENFDIFQGYNLPQSHKHVLKPLNADELTSIAQQLFNILEQVRGAEDSIGIIQLKVATFQSLDTSRKLAPVIAALREKDNYQFVNVNELLPTDSRARYNFICLVKRAGLPFKATLYTYAAGGNVGNFHFMWKVDTNDGEDTILTKATTLSTEIQELVPHFHTRQMRREFCDKFGKVANVKPVYLREMYRRLTNDCTAVSSDMDQRLQHMLDFQDPDIVVDLRELNCGRPAKYDVFWDQTDTYLSNVVETAVQERRHDSICYLATAMSVRHLLETVEKRCPPGTAIPSKQWLRLQFWPKNPSTKASLQYTGRLNIKYMVQQRQLRNQHEDAHYASAIFRYEKEMAIRFRENATFVTMDDKHKIKVGEPGHPVAAVERGKQVLVGSGQSFQVSDHDFTKLTLTPSITLRVDIPENIEGSFYRSRVFAGIKDSTFQSSSPQRHAAELCQILKGEDIRSELLFVYTDGGPDHRVSYLSVQLTYIAIFLHGDYDAVVAARTPPGHSWKNPTERIMSTVNLALQAVGVMRSSMPENF
ncbi:uncharacterized protein [Ptychodera flava]|uniref:uncharacterized protein isoform X2 n=1 Tax=Ptychodera flava TaxID=63121 RepID=UPI00396A0281